MTDAAPEPPDDEATLLGEVEIEAGDDPGGGIDAASVSAIAEVMTSVVNALQPWRCPITGQNWRIEAAARKRFLRLLDLCEPGLAKALGVEPKGDD